MHLKDGICNRFFCVYLVKRQMGRFKRVFVVWCVIYSTRQRKTTRTNGNKPNGKRFSFVGLPFWLCRVLQDDSERHFFFAFLFCGISTNYNQQRHDSTTENAALYFSCGRRRAFYFSGFLFTHAQEESQLQGSELTATIDIA